MAPSTGSLAGDGDTEDPKSELRALTVEEAGDLDRTRRGDSTRMLLVDAEQRDENAEVRDAVADERERVADRLAFTDRDAP